MENEKGEPVSWQEVDPNPTAFAISELAAAVLQLAEAVRHGSKPSIFVHSDTPKTFKNPATSTAAAASDSPGKGLDRKPTSCNRCGKPIFWEKSRNDKNIPLDFVEVPDGTHCVHDGRAQKYDPQYVDPDCSRFTCHFETCSANAPKAAPASAPEGIDDDIPF